MINHQQDKLGALECIACNTMDAYRLNICHLNLSNFVPKINFLRDTFESSMCHIIVCSETWFKAHQLPGYYVVNNHLVLVFIVRHPASISNYLDGRSLRVTLWVSYGVLSESIAVGSGVPQGSVIGSLHFSLMTNGLPDVLAYSDYILFFLLITFS